MIDLYGEILKAVTDYSADIDKEINLIIKDVTAEVEERLKSGSPEDEGKYADSWRVKITRSKGVTSAVVYNEKYQLTHLLEDGHANRDGSWTEGQKHIEPVEKWAVDEVERRIEGLFG